VLFLALDDKDAAAGEHEDASKDGQFVLGQSGGRVPSPLTAPCNAPRNMLFPMLQTVESSVAICHAHDLFLLFTKFFKNM
jgi:hypothetical protein